jgi:predicted Fe-Mo cluster-binding NifX family protein
MEHSLTETRVAFAVWNSRIAPVFDVAHQVRIVHIASGLVVEEKSLRLAEEPSTQRALHLAEQGVRTLVCGAISRHVLAMMHAYGINVISSVTGELNEVLQAYLEDGLESHHQRKSVPR